MENADLEVTIINSNEALEATIRAEIDVAVATAKKYPRDIQKCRADALATVTLSQKIAESCHYALKRKGQNGDTFIEGPSVRLAEIIASCFGNLKTARRIVGNNGKYITAEAICIDTEKNISNTCQVQRRITTKEGKTFSEDMQVVTANAAAAIAYRNAVLTVIPLALTEDIGEAAKQMALGKAADLPTNRAKYLQYLQENFKVTVDEILKAINRPSIEMITLEDLRLIKGFITAIGDKESTVDEIFRPGNIKSEPEPLDLAELEAITNAMSQCETVDALKSYFGKLETRIQTGKQIIRVKESVKKALELSKPIGK